MSFNKPFIFILLFDLSELLCLGQTSDFLHSLHFYLQYSSICLIRAGFLPQEDLWHLFSWVAPGKIWLLKELFVLLWLPWFVFFTHQKLPGSCHSCWNSCCKFLPMLPLASAGATFREQLPETSQIFINSQGFGQLLSVVIPGKTFDPRKVSGTAAQMWSHMVTSWKNHQVGMRSVNARMPLGFFLLIFHVLVWYSRAVVFPLNYLRSFSSVISDFFHHKSALSCSIISPSPTASLGSNVRAPKSLFQAKSALCQQGAIFEGERF